MMNRFIQGQNDRNRAALKFLIDIGFEVSDVRRGLIIMNKINISQLAKDHEVSAPSLYNTLRGARVNGKSKEALSSALGVDSEEMFPPLNITA